MSTTLIYSQDGYGEAVDYRTPIDDLEPIEHDDLTAFERGGQEMLCRIRYITGGTVGDGFVRSVAFIGILHEGAISEKRLSECFGILRSTVNAARHKIVADLEKEFGSRLFVGRWNSRQKYADRQSQVWKKRKAKKPNP